MACGRTVRNFGLRRRLWRCSKAAAALGLVAFALAAPSAAAPLKTTLAVTTTDGYARLVFTASGYIDGSARQTGNVLIISFKQPLDVAVNRVAEQAPDYIGAARRDPDGTAVRMALAQNVTIHAMSAGEKFFVDLLPTSWSGMPPGLPAGAPGTPGLPPTILAAVSTDQGYGTSNRGCEQNPADFGLAGWNYNYTNSCGCHSRHRDTDNVFAFDPH